MRRLRTGSACFVAAIMILSFAWRLPGAPVLPRPEKVPDKAMSLANLERVRLEILPLTPDALGLGLTQEQLRDAWKNHLEAAEVTVVDDEEAPKLSLHLKVLADRNEGDHFAYGLFMTLEQEVQVVRLDRTLVVPTYVANVLGIESEANIREDLTSLTSFMARKFMRQLEEATAQAEREADAE